MNRYVERYAPVTRPSDLDRRDERFPGVTICGIGTPGLTNCRQPRAPRIQVRVFGPGWRREIAVSLDRSGTCPDSSLRALVKYLDEIPDSEIADLEIPTGVPLFYELDQDLKPICRHYFEALRGTEDVCNGVLITGLKPLILDALTINRVV